MKILILGGYGTFGGRLAQLLADTEGLTLIIAGRSETKAANFCRSIPFRARTLALAFDRDGNVERQIQAIKPDLMVDATGPFQLYGDDPYRVVKACLACNVSYLDLADGSDFVKGIFQFDAEAKAKNLFVIAGASSFPVLTAAVLRRLSQGLAHVGSIKGGIAPSPYAGVGLNVIRAIAGYSGQRIALVRDGQQRHGYALTETMRYTISPPGRLPLRNTRFSLVDVPDLQVLPELWPNARSIWMGAGPVPEILHRMLNGLAWLVRFKALPSLLPLASLFHHAINILRWGEHRGGMFVSVDGTRDDGKQVERSWHLLAEGDDGPFIPSMAIEAIVRRCLAGAKPAPGARPATQDLELSDYEALFSKRTIYTGQREQLVDKGQEPLYQKILGDEWHALPASLRAMHDVKTNVEAEGIAEIERGNSLVSKFVALCFGFPKAGRDIPVKVSFKAQEGREVWQRTFAGRSFSSLQFEGQGRFDRLLCEKFGAFSVGLALVHEDGKLRLVVRRWSLFGLPLPSALAPRGNTYEYEENGRFCFHVEISHPLTGLIVRYRGWLKRCG